MMVILLRAVDDTFFLACVALAWLVAGSFERADDWRLWACCLFAVVAAVLALKVLTREARPDRSNELSFPSGHAALAAYIAHGVAATAGRRWPWAAWGGWAWAAAAGAARVHLRKHYAHDVLAGWALGWASGRLVLRLVLRPGADAGGALTADRRTT